MGDKRNEEPKIKMKKENEKRERKKRERGGVKFGRN
jgi:hypothetical protein